MSAAAPAALRRRAIGVMAVATLVGVLLPLLFWNTVAALVEFGAPVVSALPFLLSWWMPRLTRSWRAAMYGAAASAVTLLAAYAIVYVGSATDPLVGFLLLPLPYVNLLIVFPLAIFIGLRRSTEEHEDSNAVR